MDTELVLRAQRGDAAAFAALVGETAGRLRGVAMSILRDPDLADDATQRSLVSIWRNLHDLHDPSRFEAWSYRLLVNSCYSQIRAAKRRADVPAEAVNAWPAGGNPFDLVADQEMIERSFTRLPMQQRAVVTLHHRFGLSLDRVAAVLGVPVGTVYSRLHRAMDGLRAAIEADEREGVVGPDPGATLALPGRHRARPWLPGPIPPAPGRADGRRILVAPDGSGDASSIDQAVRMAREGDVVLVRPGIYRESVVLRRDVAVVGDGDRDSIILDYHGQEPMTLTGVFAGLRTPVGVLFDRTRASLTNMTLRGPRESVAIMVHGGAPAIRHLAAWLDGAWQGPPTFRNFLYVCGDAGGVIADCESDAHVIVHPGSPTVERNDLGAALLVMGPSSRAIVRDNAIVVRTRTTLALNVGLGAAPIIEGNEVSWFDGKAISVAGGSAPIIRGNVIRHSRIGIGVFDRGLPTILDNDVEATTTGILVRGADPLVSGNVLSGTAPGSIVVLGDSRAAVERNAVDPSVHSRPTIGTPAVRPSITPVRGGRR